MMTRILQLLAALLILTNQSIAENIYQPEFADKLEFDTTHKAFTLQTQNIDTIHNLLGMDAFAILKRNSETVVNFSNAQSAYEVRGEALVALLAKMAKGEATKVEVDSLETLQKKFSEGVEDFKTAIKNRQEVLHQFATAEISLKNEYHDTPDFLQMPRQFDSSTKTFNVKLSDALTYLRKETERGVKHVERVRRISARFSDGDRDYFNQLHTYLTNIIDWMDGAYKEGNLNGLLDGSVEKSESVEYPKILEQIEKSESEVKEITRKVLSGEAAKEIEASQNQCTVENEVQNLLDAVESKTKSNFLPHLTELDKSIVINKATREFIAGNAPLESFIEQKLDDENYEEAATALVIWKSGMRFAEEIPESERPPALKSALKDSENKIEELAKKIKVSPLGEALLASFEPFLQPKSQSCPIGKEE